MGYGIKIIFVGATHCGRPNKIRQYEYTGRHRGLPLRPYYESYKSRVSPVDCLYLVNIITLLEITLINATFFIKKRY